MRISGQNPHGVRRLAVFVRGRCDHAGMDYSELRRHLDAEYALMLAATEAAEPDARVPTCPDWTATDLAHHVAVVYLHKVEAIRLQAWPRPWPPDLSGQAPAAALTGGWAALTGQLDAHQPGDPARTWYDLDQTVGFWVRRMAQETVIHRIDAQLAAGQPVSPIDPDFAVDTVDEVLTLFLEWGSKDWAQAYAGAFDDVDSRILEIATPQRSWFVAANHEGVIVEEAPNADVAARVSGDAESLARWLWNRGGDGGVTTSGDASLVEQLKGLLVRGTQ